ncbi:alpha/beta fold hydrolase [Spirochaeta isovalerica]|uniref:Pimeloyl-ACP methyl ester carboxylesterase n=1 Tax=Spirochaeta isovalerica TaxID=150 RepID=A0A841RIC9_9SPIO|nr:alpha/beta hydrolase [Spirochaeta isovalerica]MBB6482288.1 pimeloyl-ACP methyl ester carboxylesterase [Spirochaeta isovalerica]
MNQNKIILVFFTFILAACTPKQVALEERFGYQLVNSEDHKLATKTFGKGNVTIILEAGLNTQCKTWIDSGIVSNLEKHAKVIIYSRPGIYPSDNSEHPANISNMIKDLDAVINKLAKGEKLILVGHSLGGVIIRAYSIKYPKKVDGLVFVDTAHEVFIDATQEEVIAHLSDMGVPDTDPYYKEMIEMRNTLEYISNIGTLPDIPVISLSALGLEKDPLDNKERRLLKELNDDLSIGLSDFTNIEVSDSGHFIQNDQPDILISAILDVLRKIK